MVETPVVAPMAPGAGARATIFWILGSSGEVLVAKQKI
jgi:hypothetical protein